MFHRTLQAAFAAIALAVVAPSQTITAPASGKEGAKIDISYTNSALAGQVVYVDVEYGYPAHVDSFKVELDSTGKGTFQYVLPLNELAILINAPGAIEAVVWIDPVN